MKTKVILLALPLLIVAGGVFAESKVWTSGNYKYELTDDGLKIVQINSQSTSAQKPSLGQGRQQASAPASSPSPISPAPASIDTETEPEPEIAQEPIQETPATTETISDIQETTTPSDEPAAEPEAAGGVLETIVESVEDTAASVFNGFLNLFKVFKF
jgi:hypothetical protein